MGSFTNLRERTKEPWKKEEKILSALMKTQEKSKREQRPFLGVDFFCSFDQVTLWLCIRFYNCSAQFMCVVHTGVGRPMTWDWFSWTIGVGFHQRQVLKKNICKGSEHRRNTEELVGGGGKEGFWLCVTTTQPKWVCHANQRKFSPAPLKIKCRIVYRNI